MPTSPSSSKTADPPRDQASCPTEIARPGVSGSAEAPLVAGLGFGRYRLTRELGAGGMGVVWEAWDTQLHRRVAVKFLHPVPGGERASDVARFVREAQLAAKLKHPHILAVHDVGVAGDRHWFAADYVAGRSLDGRACVGGENPVPVRTAVQWVRTVAEALHYAHGQGVVHRDVKPGNILLDESDQPFVSDFGLAKDVAVDPAAGKRLTVSGSLLGTPSYMSPEQARGALDELGPSTDQFSLGVVLYELLTGKLPFDGDTVWDVLRGIAEREPAPPSRVHARVHRDLDTVCLRALEKDPARRYPSMAAFAADLGRYLEGEPIVARPAAAATRMLRLARKHRSALVPIAASLLLAGAWAWRVEREMDLETERMRAAVQEQESRSRLLQEKGYRTALVLARWSALEPEVRAIESLHYSSRMIPLGAALRAREPLRRIELDLKEAAADPMTRGTARALIGWARWLAGHWDDGVRCMREAAAADPDIPFGALLEALTLLSWYLDEQQLPGFVYGDEGVRFTGKPVETPRMAGLRTRMEELLGQSEGKSVWGSEGASAYRAAMAAIRHMNAGRYVEAEQGFTVALASGEMKTFRSGMRLARARVRYLRRDFDAALTDLAVLERAWPDHAGVRFLESVGCLGAAVEGMARGEDSTTRLDRALERGREAIERDPRQSAFRLVRALAGWYRAGLARNRGEDPRAWLDAAAADVDAGLKKRPDSVHLLRASGIVRSSLGVSARDRGQDPCPALDRAIADFEAALREEPGAPDSRRRCGVARLERAIAEVVRGGDGRAWLDAGREDLIAAAEGFDGEAAGGAADAASSTPNARLAAAHVELAGIFADLAGSRRALPHAKEFRDRAFEHLRRALDAGTIAREAWANDRKLASLRTDPRWAALMKEVEERR